MDPKDREQLNELEVKVNEIHKTMKQIKLYLQVTAWVTIIFFVLPLLILIFAIPSMIRAVSDYSSLLSI